MTASLICLVFLAFGLAGWINGLIMIILIMIYLVYLVLSIYFGRNNSKIPPKAQFDFTTGAGTVDNLDIYTGREVTRRSINGPHQINSEQNIKNIQSNINFEKTEENVPLFKSENSTEEHSMTQFSEIFQKEKPKNWIKFLPIILLSYLYITIPVQGNFLFRHKYAKHLVLFFSFVFFLFTLKLPLIYFISCVIPVILSIVDVIMLVKKGYGINFMVFEVWGILIGCCWIVNLMLIMMDILLFLSNIFGVSVLIFTCIFIAIGNNTAGNQLTIRFV